MVAKQYDYSLDQARRLLIEKAEVVVLTPDRDDYLRDMQVGPALPGAPALYRAVGSMGAIAREAGLVPGPERRIARIPEQVPDEIADLAVRTLGHEAIVASLLRQSSPEQLANLSAMIAQQSAAHDLS